MLLGLAGLWSLGVLPHAPRLTLSDGGPTWAEVRNPHDHASRLEMHLGNVASSIAGRHVQVRCEDLSDVGDTNELGGVVRFSQDTPANYARISLEICNQLERVLRDGGTGGGVEARGIEVLAHESFHLRGVKNEAAAECYAIQFIPSVAHLLGVDAAHAVSMQERAHRAYRYHPREYLSPECRPGGALDLHGTLPSVS